MENQLKAYFDAQLAKYSKRMDAHGAMIAAKFALDDMAGVVRRNLTIYSAEDVSAILAMEIEDVCAA